MHRMLHHNHSILLIVAAAAALQGIVNAFPIPPPTVKWYNQTLDHFDYGNNQRFQQRYLVTEEYYNGKGPIFFYTGNEENIVSFYNNSGAVFAFARALNALVVFAEHRFYGESIPCGNESFVQPCLGKLSSVQALEDYVELVGFLRQQYNAAGAPVLAVGGSYGGMLTAWARMKYPFVFDAAWASSAPLAACPDSMPAPAFLQAVTKDYAQAAPGCDQAIRVAFGTMFDVAARPGGYAALAKALRLCEVPKEEDMDAVAFYLQNAFVYNAMLDYPYPSSFLRPLPANPVNATCDTIHGVPPDQPLARLLAGANVWYNATGNLQCHSVNTTERCGDPTGCGDFSNTDAVAWNYQACTEFSLPASSNNVTDMFPPFPWNTTWQRNYCQRQFNVTPTPNWMCEHYGGLNMGAASRLIMSNGLRDPWRVGGLMQSVGESVVAIPIADASHHLDLRSPNSQDPVAVTQARNLELSLITKWMAQAAEERKGLMKQ